jgi:hypothetical protein
LWCFSSFLIRDILGRGFFLVFCCFLVTFLPFLSFFGFLLTFFEQCIYIDI